MKYGLNVKPEGALDFVSLGALVHRLDPGSIPFRKEMPYPAEEGRAVPCVPQPPW